MKTIITAILIIVAVAAVLFILPFAIMFFSYVFGIDMDENGGLHGRGQRTGKILTGIRQEKTGEEKQKGG